MSEPLKWYDHNAEAALGNRDYFLNKPYGIGGRENGDVRDAPCALTEPLLTLPGRPGTIWPCVSRFSVRFPTLKLSPPDPAFAKSRDCDGFTDTYFETMTKTQAKQLVVCIENEGYAVSLEKRKIYVRMRDAAAEKHDMLRIVDESGEDYLYPKAFFRVIALPQAVKRAVLAA